MGVSPKTFGRFSLAVLPLLFCELFLLWRLPTGWHPFLLPCAIALPAQKEGCTAFGLLLGLLATFLGHGVVMPFLFTLAGFLLAFLFSWMPWKGFAAVVFGALFTSSFVLAGRMLLLMLGQNASFFDLFSIAAPELLLSNLTFLPYALCGRILREKQPALSGGVYL